MTKLKNLKPGDEVELSDAALLREYTSKQLVEEVLRRIAAGEEGEQFEVDRKRPRIEVEINDEQP